MTLVMFLVPSVSTMAWAGTARRDTGLEIWRNGIGKIALERLGRAELEKAFEIFSSSASTVLATSHLGTRKELFGQCSSVGSQIFRSGLFVDRDSFRKRIMRILSLMFRLSWTGPVVLVISLEAIPGAS